MTAEAEKRAEDTCIHVVAQMLCDNIGKPADEIAVLLGKRWANLCMAVEGSVRRKTAEQCADIAETFGDVEIRDKINEQFGLRVWD